MVVGCGSLGNELLKDLVLLGVQHLTLVDFDRIESSNLSRTILYTPADVGRYKVEVARERLLQLNPSLDVQTLCADIIHDVGLGIIRSMDVIVSCVDSRWARFMINRHCMRMNRIWVDGGITQSEGTARVFGASVTNCYACNLGTTGIDQLRRRMPCSNTIRRIEQSGHVPTGIIPASVVGAVMAQQVLQALDGNPSLLGHMFSFDADTLQARKVLFRAYDDDCVEHQAWEDIQQSELTHRSTVAEVLQQYGTLWLRDDCYVDYLIDRREDHSVPTTPDNHRHTVMCPGRKVIEAMEQTPQLRGRLTGDFYQHEYRVIDATFPYPHLTLAQLGIPPHDILQTAQATIQLA